MEYKKDTPGGLCYKEGTDDALTILGYNGSSGILDLTQIYEGKTITAIAEGAFRGCDNLKKLSFRNPDTILSDIFQANDDWVEKVVINGEPGGSIERFAQENNLRFNRFLKAVSLKTKPTKLDYFYGETLNLASMEILVEYDSDADPKTELLNAQTIQQSASITGYNAKNAGIQTVTVTYGGQMVMKYRSLRITQTPER